MTKDTNRAARRRSSREAPERKTRRWIWAAAAVAFLIVGAGLTQPWSRDSAPGAYVAYADASRPSVAFLYTVKPHRMPDGSEMY